MPQNRCNFHNFRKLTLHLQEPQGRLMPASHVSHTSSLLISLWLKNTKPGGIWAFCVCLEGKVVLVNLPRERAAGLWSSKHHPKINLLLSEASDKLFLFVKRIKGTQFVLCQSSWQLWPPLGLDTRWAHDQLNWGSSPSHKHWGAMLELSRCWGATQRLFLPKSRLCQERLRQKKYWVPEVFPVPFVPVPPFRNSPSAAADGAVEVLVLPLIPLTSSDSRWGWACLFPSLQAWETCLYSSSMSCPLFHLSLLLVLFIKLSERFPFSPATPAHLLAHKGRTMHPWAAQNRLRYWWSCWEYFHTG